MGKFNSRQISNKEKKICERKITYFHVVSAQQQADVLSCGYEEYEAYKCDICSRYHIGHKLRETW